MSVKDGLIGAKGGGSSKFRNRPDNLRTTDTFEALIGLTTGKIKGLAPGGLQNLFVDDVPIEDSSGNSNLKDFVATLFTGDPAVLEPIKLQLGGSSGATSVGLSVNNPNYPSPGDWRNATVTVPGVDYIDLRFVTQALYRQSKDGIYDETASIEIQLQASGSTTWINPLSSVTAPTYDVNGQTFATSDGGAAAYRLYAQRNLWEPADVNQWYDPAPGFLRITGKTTQNAVKELRIAVPNTGPWENKTWSVRVRLIERDSYVQDQNEEKRTILWESIAGVSSDPIGDHEEWRGLAYLQIYGKASDQLNGIPNINGIYDLTEVMVPPASVWNPITRAYTGAVWDGTTYERQWTQCPAWQLKDLIEDPLSGISALSPGSTLNKWDVLEASKWYSEHVQDGDGGTHPRYSMNYLLSSGMAVNDLIQYVAGATGSYSYDEGDGRWRVVVDKPTAPVALFTLEDIVGQFNYSHTDIDSRFNDLTGVFRNEANRFEEDRVRVYDQDHIDTFGRRHQSIALVGCTNRQEALRRLKLRQIVSTKETRIVNFVTNRKGALLMPFNVIMVADGDLGDHDERTTGRIVAKNVARTEITLRDTVRLELGVTYKVHFTIPNPDYDPNATVQPDNEEWMKPTITIERTLTNTSGQRGDVRVLYLSSALPSTIPENAPVALSAVGLPTLPKQYRVLDVEYQDDELVRIAAIEIYTAKWDESDAITEEAIFGQVPQTVIPPPTDMAFAEKSYESNFQTKRVLAVTWSRPASTWVEGFNVKFSINDGPANILAETLRDNYIELENPTSGKYTFYVSTIDRRNRNMSTALVGSYELDETAPPGGVHTIGPLADRPVTAQENELYTTDDQSPNVTYVWRGGAWHRVANDVNWADEITYDDGTPVEDLKPAQPGSDVTGDNTSQNTYNVGSKSAAQIVAEVDELFTTYGPTAAAAVSAALAATEADNAIAASIAAGGYATTASTKRDEAAGFSSAAQASALTASSAAAGIGLTKNAHFNVGLTDWNRLYNSPGTQVTVQPTFQSATNVATNSVGTAAEIASSFSTVNTARKYRLRARFYSNGTALAVMYVGLNCLDAAGIAIGTASGVLYGFGAVPASGWTEYSSPVITGEQDANGTGGWAGGFRAGTKQVSVMSYLNFNTTAGAQFGLDYLYLEDVTESENSGISASAAAASAVAAGLSESSAATSQTLAANYSTAARLQVARQLPGTFEQDGTHFSINYTGAPESLTPLVADAIWNFQTVSGVGRVLQINAASAEDVATIGVLPVLPGGVYRVSMRHRTLTGTRGVQAYMIGLNSSYVYVSLAGNAVGITSTTTWTTTTVEMNATDLLAAGIVFLRAYASWGTGAAVGQISQLLIEDITQVKNATTQAGISTTQAAAATAAAATATTQATLSSTFSTGSNLSALQTLPSTFEQDGAFFCEGNGAGWLGAPSTLPAVTGSGIYSFTTIAGVGRVAQTASTAATRDIAQRGVIAVKAGRKYQVSATHSVDTGTRAVSVYAITMDAAYGYLGASVVSASATSTTAWTTVSTVAIDGTTLLAAGVAYIRAIGRFAAGSPVGRFSQLRIEDITESVAAAAGATVATSQADISTAQAVISTAQAALAQSNATLSATYRADTVRINGNAGFDLGKENWFFNETAVNPIEADANLFVQNNVISAKDLRLNPSVGSRTIFNGTLIPIDTSKKYRFRTKLYAYESGGGTGATVQTYVGFVGLDANGAYVNHGAYGTYRYCLATPISLTHNQQAAPEVIVTGEGNDSWTKFPPGTKYIRTMAILNYNNSIMYSYISGIEVEDVTSLETASTQATIATSQAAIATAQAAAAQTSATLTASLTNTSFIKNVGFDDYPSGAVGAVPAAWVNIANTSLGYRVTDPQGGYAWRLPAAAGAETYCGQSTSSFSSAQYVKQNDYVVFEGDVTLNSGTLVGSGVLLYISNSGGTTVQQDYIRFAVDKDMSGTVVGNGVAGTRYRFQKLMKITDAAAYGCQLYVMSHWSTLGSIAAANDITWWKGNVRPATPQEIAAGVALPALEATVTTQAAALATHDTKLATWLTRVSAGAGTAEVAITASDSGGSPASSISLRATKIMLGSLTDPALEIVGGVSTFKGELNVGGTTGGRVNIFKNVIKIYNDSGVLVMKLGNLSL